MLELDHAHGTVGDEQEEDHVGEVVRRREEDGQRDDERIGALAEEDLLDAEEHEGKEHAGHEEARPDEPLEERDREGVGDGTDERGKATATALERVEREAHAGEPEPEDDESLVEVLGILHGGEDGQQVHRVEDAVDGDEDVRAIPQTELPGGNLQPMPADERRDDAAEPLPLEGEVGVVLLVAVDAPEDGAAVHEVQRHAEAGEQDEGEVEAAPV